MSKFYRVLATIFLILLAGLLVWGGFEVLNKSNLKNIISQNLPDVSTLGTVNLPGKLFGPQEPDRAKTLDPAKIIEWTNYYRAQNDLKNLSLNPQLTQAAQTKVQDMFANQYFEHVSPSGVAPNQLVLAANYNYKVTGENLALGDFKDEKDLVDAWMGSPGHRANILNPDYTEIGVASGLNKFEDRNLTWLSVQEFGAPAPSCAKPDQELAQKIDDKKAEYDRLKSEYDVLVANKKLTKEQYQEAVTLQTELNNLYQEINVLVNQYNVQVDAYNACIKT